MAQSRSLRHRQPTDRRGGIDPPGVRVGVKLDHAPEGVERDLEEVHEVQHAEDRLAGTEVRVLLPSEQSRLVEEATRLARS